jgi:small subunit ribosomal protein S21
MLIVQVKDKNINRALKELKSKFIKTRVTKELFDRKNFKKKGVERREEIQKAIYREKLKRKDN